MIQSPTSDVRHFAFVLVTSLSLLGFQDEPEIARWIADLAHEQIERRDHAARELWKCGASALPAIRKALERGVHSDDAKTRKTLVDLERAIGESVFDAQQRPRALQLVTFDDRDYRLDEIAADLDRQTKWVFKVEVDASLSMRLGGKDRPLREVLDSIEEKLGVTITRLEKNVRALFEIKPGRPPDRRRIHIPGVTYSVRRGPPLVRDKLKGWVLETELADPSDARIGSIEVLGSDGKALPLLTCPWCSPGRMFVKTALKEKVRVRFRGNVLWRSTYDLRIDAVEKPQRFQVGRYEISYEFLKTRVEPSPSDDEEWPPTLELSYKYKKGDFWQPKSATRMKVQWVSKTHASWCDKPVDADGTLKSSWPIISSDWNEDREIDPADLEAVRIHFSKPVKEPFDREIDLPPSE